MPAQRDDVGNAYPLCHHRMQHYQLRARQVECGFTTVRLPSTHPSRSFLSYSQQAIGNGMTVRVARSCWKEMLELAV